MRQMDSVCCAVIFHCIAFQTFSELSEIIDTILYPILVKTLIILVVNSERYATGRFLTGKSAMTSLFGRKNRGNHKCLKGRRHD